MRAIYLVHICEAENTNHSRRLHSYWMLSYEVLWALGVWRRHTDTAQHAPRTHCTTRPGGVDRNPSHDCRRAQSTHTCTAAAAAAAALTTGADYCCCCSLLFFSTYSISHRSRCFLVSSFPCLPRFATVSPASGGIFGGLPESRGTVYQNVPLFTAGWEWDGKVGSWEAIRLPRIDGAVSW